MTESLCVKRRIGDYIRKKGFNSSEKFYLALEEELVNIIDKAIKRCELNNRKTLSNKDL